jgi:hypothetical protein
LRPIPLHETPRFSRFGRVNCTEAHAILDAVSILPKQRK